MALRLARKTQAADLIVPPAETSPSLQRAAGRANASVRLVEGRTRIAELHQAGCLKLRFPRVPGTHCEAVLINSSGGLTGGDRLTQSFEVGEGAVLSATTQACERIYRAMSGEAQVATAITVGRQASFAFLPQETILFDGAALARRLDVSFAGSSRVLLVESVILGRTLMGESVEAGRIADRWRLRRDGSLIFADDLRFDGPVSRIAAGRASLAGGRAFATVVLAAADAETHLDNARTILKTAGAASALPGLVVARLVADSGFALRKTLVPLLRALAKDPLPRLWSL